MSVLTSLVIDPETFCTMNSKHTLVNLNTPLPCRLRVSLSPVRLHSCLTPFTVGI